MGNEDNISKIILDINKYCFKNHIQFFYVLNQYDTATKNKIEQNIDNGENNITLTIFDMYDENLFKMLSDFYSDLIKYS